MPDHAPDVSVIIPTVGKWRLLADTLASALDQVGVDLEVIVADDASRDETARELRRIRDPRLRVYRRETRGGPAASRNTAIDEARGEWLAFLDDDDIWAPENLRVKLATLDETGSDVVYGAVIMTDELNTPLYHFDPPDPETILPALLEASVIPGGPSNVVARASLVRDVGAFDERFALLSDWDLFIRLAVAGRMSACPETLVAYRRSAASMSGDQQYAPAAELRLLVEKHAALSRRLDVAVDEERVARWSAGERRRRLTYRARSESARGRHARAAGFYLLSAVRYLRVGDLRLAAAALRPGRVAAPSGDLDRPAWLGPRQHPADAT
jgi:glycosyltransferase involved in cell wall biosynthesis